jgi:hypothetical protein
MECPKQGLGQLDLSGWKTYRNEKYGFEVKYPEEWSIKFEDEIWAVKDFELVLNFATKDNPGYVLGRHIWRID